MRGVKGTMTEIYTINHLTEWEMAEYQEKYPQSNPQEWELMSGKFRIGWYATEEDAKDARAELLMADALEREINDWIGEMTDKGYEYDAIKQAIRDFSF
jgi:hypothetical protein